jgi:hypothetical protein
MLFAIIVHFLDFRVSKVRNVVKINNNQPIYDIFIFFAFYGVKFESPFEKFNKNLKYRKVQKVKPFVRKLTPSDKTLELQKASKLLVKKGVKSFSYSSKKSDEKVTLKVLEQGFTRSKIMSNDSSVPDLRIAVNSDANETSIKKDIENAEFTSNLKNTCIISGGYPKEYNLHKVNSSKVITKNFINHAEKDKTLISIESLLDGSQRIDSTTSKVYPENYYVGINQVNESFALEVINMLSKDEEVVFDRLSITTGQLLREIKFDI